ncbi:MAG: CrcB family protein [Solirubrobacterales bacterium]|nr:CrcB family protein [Solirubrobacterales bacterium]MCB8915090.1 CrcB family protein [Thermoleophilales bacterium]
MSIFGLEILGWLLVGLLGGLAAGARYLLDAEISRLVDSPFPFGILVVNLTGSFLLGLLSGTVLHGQALVIVAGGVIGSFTTFSTWILDTRLLQMADLAKLAWLNLSLSLACGLAAVALGQTITG